jgi:hypothetical protein
MGHDLTGKNHLSARLFGGLALFALVLLFASCLLRSEPEETDEFDSTGSTVTPITGITVYPATAVMAKDGTRQFSATVTGTNAPAAVTWSVETEVGEKPEKTTITGKGRLHVDSGESESTLIVKAVSTADPSKFNTATVTVQRNLTGTIDGAETKLEKPDDPVTLNMAIELSPNNWKDLLDVIAYAKKKVNLDLAASFMPGNSTVFDLETPDGSSKGAKEIVSLVLPGEVTVISGDSLFSSFTSLTSVTGSSVKTIGASAFDACSALEAIDFPEVVSIGNYAFGYCASLESVDFSKVVSIGGNAFLDCISLKTVNLPSTLKEISGRAFCGCVSLTKIEVGANGDYRSLDGMLLNARGTTLIAYAGPDADPDSVMVLANSITDVGSYAFAGRTGLTTVSLPSVITVGDNAFAGCTGLTTVNLPLVMSIASSAVSKTGGNPLTVNLGSLSPSLVDNIFSGVPDNKIVIGTASVTATLNENLTVPKGKTLIVNEGTTLTIAAGKTLTVAGTLMVAGTLTVAAGGAIDVEDGGTYVLEKTGSGTNAGTITIKSGGETWGKGGSIAGAGFTVVKQGGKAYLGTTEKTKVLIIGSTPTEDGTDPVFELVSGSVAFNNTDYALDGEATLNGLSGTGDSQGNFMVGGSDRKLLLKAGSVLTVPGTASKHILAVVVVDADNPGITGKVTAGEQDAAKIVLQANGYIDLYAPSAAYSSVISGLDHNFYTSAGAKVTNNSLHGTTYKWSNTAGGDSKPGWKALQP